MLTLHLLFKFILALKILEKDTKVLSDYNTKCNSNASTHTHSHTYLRQTHIFINNVFIRM